MASAIPADRSSVSRAANHERENHGGSSREVREDRPSRAASCMEWKSSEYEKRWMVELCSFGLVPCLGRAGELPGRRGRCRGIVVPSCVRWTRDPRRQASRLAGRSVERCFHLELLVKVIALVARVHLGVPREYDPRGIGPKRLGESAVDGGSCLGVDTSG